MKIEEFVKLLDNYGIDYFYDNTNEIIVNIDDVNLLNDEFEAQQDEIMNILIQYPELGQYTFYSEDE